MDSKLGKTILEAMVLYKEIETIRNQADLISTNRRRAKDHIPATMACNPSIVTPGIEFDIL